MIKKSKIRAAKPGFVGILGDFRAEKLSDHFAKMAGLGPNPSAVGPCNRPRVRSGRQAQPIPCRKFFPSFFETAAYDKHFHAFARVQFDHVPSRPCPHKNVLMIIFEQLYVRIAIYRAANLGPVLRVELVQLDQNGRALHSRRSVRGRRRVANIAADGKISGLVLKYTVQHQIFFAAVMGMGGKGADAYT